MNKTEMKRMLFDLSSPEERKELSMLESANVEKAIAKLHEAAEGGAKSSEITSLTEALSEAIRKMKVEQAHQMKEMVEAFKEMQEAFLKGLGSLKEVMVEQDFNKNAGPLYKTMINSIAGVEKAVTNKPVPHWAWPQYAAVSVRNKSFANINPSISPFGIEDYDEIDLTYTGSNITTVVYKLNSVTMGTLTLSYSGSNITKVVRT
jgi:chemotaxis regulatin CheY-phosphate phosphatase CheZ